MVLFPQLSLGGQSVEPEDFAANLLMIDDNVSPADDVEIFCNQIQSSVTRDRCTGTGYMAPSVGYQKRLLLPSEPDNSNVTGREQEPRATIWHIGLRSVIPTTRSTYRSLSQSLGGTFVQLAMVDNPRFAVGISLISVIIPEILVLPVFATIIIVISGCRPLLQLLDDNFFKLSMVVNPRFVGGISIMSFTVSEI